MDQQTKPSQPVDEKQAEFMIGALVGAMAGAAAALLLTPKNGKEMRSIVKQYAKEWETEAYELAKEGKGVTKSLRQALDEGAATLTEAAPQAIGGAAQQAQHFAANIEQHIEAARDTVSEIAEAFRSGWEEYGEELLSADQLPAAQSTPKVELPDVLMPSSPDDQDADEQAEAPSKAEPQAITHSAPSHGRRRSSSHHYAMHSAQADKHTSDNTSDHSPKTTARPLLASEEIVDQPAPTSHYTTRVLEQVSPAPQVKAEDKPAKEDKSAKEDKPAKKAAKEASASSGTTKNHTDTDNDGKPAKKLFFRRGA